MNRVHDKASILGFLDHPFPIGQVLGYPLETNTAVEGLCRIDAMVAEAVRGLGPNRPG
jgi:hypothetical protein